ncbi:MAG: hypothetical protein ACXW3U_01290 [Rhodoplanes sp.]
MMSFALAFAGRRLMMGASAQSVVSDTERRSKPTRAAFRDSRGLRLPHDAPGRVVVSAAIIADAIDGSTAPPAIRIRAPLANSISTTLLRFAS